MSDYAHDYTDEKIAELERRITAHYKRVFDELSEKVEKYFAQFEKRDKEQQEALNRGEITELQYQQWRLAQMGRGKRFEAMRDEAAERLTKANQIAAAYIKGKIPDIFAVNRNHLAYGLEKEYGNIGFTIYDEQMVRKLIAEQADFLPAPSINIPKDLWWNKQLITAEMTSGILQGESIGKLADRFQNVTDANRVSAIRNARTFCTAAENAGRYDGYKAAEKLGIKGLKKQWLATLDGRTRHSHRELDGQTVGWNEKFESVLGSKMLYPGDKTGAKPGDLYNCRCTMITVEKSGIVVDEEFATTTDDGQQISKMKFDEWKSWKNNLDPEKAKEYNKAGIANAKIDFKQNKLALAKEKTENAIESAYEHHRKANRLTSVPFDEIKKTSFVEFVNYKGLTDDVADVFAESIEALTKKYDTSLYKVSTMSKKDAFFNNNIYAYVVHNYETDTAEMLINPYKFKNIKESIRKQIEKNYCADILESNYEKYVITHEFAHSLIDIKTPLKNSRNWVNVDYRKIQKARKEIEAIYNDYIKEISNLEKMKKDAEMRFILALEDTTKEIAEIKAELQFKKISNYSMENADEFMAECFTLSKLGNKKNIYAEKIMQIIDKYFGR